MMVAVAMVWLAAPTAAQHKDCEDFATWRQAQNYFQNANHDTSDLDRDDDGDACEGNPGYMADGGSGGNGGKGNGSGGGKDDSGSGGGGGSDLPDTATLVASEGADPTPLLFGLAGLGSLAFVLRRRLVSAG